MALSKSHPGMDYSSITC